MRPLYVNYDMIVYTKKSSQDATSKQVPKITVNLASPDTKIYRKKIQIDCYVETTLTGQMIVSEQGNVWKAR